MKKQSKALETGEYWVGRDTDGFVWGFEMVYKYGLFLGCGGRTDRHPPIPGLKVGDQIKMKAREVGK